MINEIANAVYKFYAGTEAVKSILPKFYFQQASQTALLPYAVFTLGSSNILEIAGTKTNRIETIELNISIYADPDDGGTQAVNIAEAITSNLDWTVLDFSGFIAIKRIGYETIGQIDDYYAIILTYEILVKG